MFCGCPVLLAMTLEKKVNARVMSLDRGFQLRMHCGIS
jgi:hypothetical protein